MVKSALLPVCKTDTTRSGNIRRARLVVLSTSLARTVPGRQSSFDNTLFLLELCILMQKEGNTR